MYLPHETGQLLNDRFARLSAQSSNAISETALPANLHQLLHPTDYQARLNQTSQLQFPQLYSDRIMSGLGQQQQHQDQGQLQYGQFHPPAFPASAVFNQRPPPQVYPDLLAVNQPPPSQVYAGVLAANQRLPPQVGADVSAGNQWLTQQMARRPSVQQELTAAGVLQGTRVGFTNGGRVKMQRRPVKQRLSVQARLGLPASAAHTGAKQRLQLPSPLVRENDSRQGESSYGNRGFKRMDTKNTRGRGFVRRREAVNSTSTRSVLDAELDEYMKEASAR